MNLPEQFEWRDHYRMSLNDIRDACRRYDAEHGKWPEHKYEGYAMFRALVDALTGIDLPYEEPDGWVDAR